MSMPCLDCRSAKGHHPLCIRCAPCFKQKLYYPDLCEPCQQNFEIANGEDTVEREQARGYHSEWIKSLIANRQRKRASGLNPEALWPNKEVRGKFTASWCRKLALLPIGSPVRKTSHSEERSQARESTQGERDSLPRTSSRSDAGEEMIPSAQEVRVQTTQAAVTPQEVDDLEDIVIRPEEARALNAILSAAKPNKTVQRGERTEETFAVTEETVIDNVRMDRMENMLAQIQEWVMQSAMPQAPPEDERGYDTDERFSNDPEYEQVSIVQYNYQLG